MQTNDFLVLCWHCWGGLCWHCWGGLCWHCWGGLWWHCWGGLWWQLIGGVNISNASPEYSQPERVISGSCNYSPCYLPNDLTSGQSIVLGSPSGLPEGLTFHSLPWFPVNCLFLPPISTTSVGLELCDSVYDSTDMFM